MKKNDKTKKWSASQHSLQQTVSTVNHKTKLGNNRLPSEESGIALILTLGVLSIIIVLAMGFVGSSITSQKAAVYENNATTARLLADSALQRAIGAMRFYSTMSLYYDDVKSHDEIDSVPENRKNNDFLYRLATAVDSAEYEWPSPYNEDAVDAVHWQYVYNGLSGADKRIIGRVGYVTVDSEGRLDPSACIEHGGSATNENGANEIRNGVEINEINLQNLDPGNTTNLSTTKVSNFSSTTATIAGTLTDGMRWPDWETLFSTSRLNITDSNQKDQYRAWFQLDSPADPEAFWVDINGDKIENSGEYYHRFNLARTDWDTLTVSDIVAAPTVYSDSLSTHDGTGIKWINNWTLAGTFDGNKDGDSLDTEDVTARKNQIAANIIDFCDSNSLPTTDSLTNPTYMGLDKTPYVNEIGIELQCVVTMDPKTATTKTANMNFTIRGGGEIVNMYGEDFSAETILTVKGAIYMKIKSENGATTEVNWKDFTVTVTLDSLGTLPYSYNWYEQSAFYDWQEVIEDPYEVSCTNVKCRITTASLSYDGNVVDFAKPDNPVTGESTMLAVLAEQVDSGTHTIYFHYEAEDPRQNLNYGDWDQGDYLVEGYGGTSNGNHYGWESGAGHHYGWENKKGKNSKDHGDAEIFSTPTTLSSAFIRNAPFQSPWEIGMIHRGENWETINLKTYNDNDSNYGVSETAGGGAYADGDANILDEIKMTSNVETYGKVNINSTNSRVLRALLAGIRYDVPALNNGPDGVNGTADDNSPGDPNSGTALDFNTAVTNLAADIEGSINSPFPTRAHVVKVASLTDGSEITQDSDALKEEIICKFINLTKKGASSSTITIIALAQAIKDIGDGITIHKDLDQNGVIGTANEDFDTGGLGDDINGDGDTDDTSISETISGCAYGTYDQYADEIMAEQKVMATVYRDPTTGRWRIIRYEYLED
jgi:hypothetical protein